MLRTEASHTLLCKSSDTGLGDFKHVLQALLSTAWESFKQQAVGNAVAPSPIVSSKNCHVRNLLSFDVDNFDTKTEGLHLISFVHSMQVTQSTGPNRLSLPLSLSLSIHSSQALFPCNTLWTRGRKPKGQPTGKEIFQLHSTLLLRPLNSKRDLRAKPKIAFTTLTRNVQGKHLQDNSSHCPANVWKCSDLIYPGLWSRECWARCVLQGPRQSLGVSWNPQVRNQTLESWVIASFAKLPNLILATKRPISSIARIKSWPF